MARATQVAVFATRVDTGRARGGWVITLGEPPTGESKTPEDQGGGTTLLAAEQKLRNFSPIFGGIISLSNNVEYILFLDQGTSFTPADNMVAQATQAAIAFLREAKYLGV